MGISRNQLKLKKEIKEDIVLFIHRVSQEERSIFCEVIVWVILSKILYAYKFYSERFPTQSYFRQTSKTPCPHTSCKMHWCWRWNFRKCSTLGKLYQLFIWTINAGIRNST
jgi:hypothetical protein